MCWYIAIAVMFALVVGIDVFWVWRSPARVPRATIWTIVGCDAFLGVLMLVAQLAWSWFASTICTASLLAMGISAIALAIYAIPYVVLSWGERLDSLFPRRGTKVFPSPKYKWLWAAILVVPWIAAITIFVVSSLLRYPNLFK